jgi:ribosomal-protein-alanine N-acetyltransferase
MTRVLEIERACFACDAYPRELFLDLHREFPGLFFVARRSRRIVGYCVSSISNGAAELVSIAVAPEHQATGVAKALIRRTFGALRRKRIRALCLTVRVGNSVAIRLYHRFGFRPIGRIPHYYEDRTDALLMRKRL